MKILRNPLSATMKGCLMTGALILLGFTTLSVSAQTKL